MEKQNFIAIIKRAKADTSSVSRKVVLRAMEYAPEAFKRFDKDTQKDVYGKEWSDMNMFDRMSLEELIEASNLMASLEHYFGDEEYEADEDEAYQFIRKDREALEIELNF